MTWLQLQSVITVCHLCWVCRQRLHDLFDEVTVVNVFDSNDADNLELLSRPDLGVTFTKLHCWRLTQFSKCVFMDADTLASSMFAHIFRVTLKRSKQNSLINLLQCN